jgi:ferredoxin
MTRSVLVVGAGPAAVGAALAAVDIENVRVTVLDIGGRLEDVNEFARERLAASTPGTWMAEDVATVSRLPVESQVRGLPEKRSYGSDFPFRNLGQLDGVTAVGGANHAVISGAFGGFSNVWGAQVMPFSAATFRDWPFGLQEMAPHYSAVLRHIPFAATEDDLAQLFPLLAEAVPLPALSERGAAALERYARHRKVLNKRGVTLGAARLAMHAPDCVRCGLCLTGCPYGLIYSASHTLDRLRSEGRIAYVDQVLAVRIEEGVDGASVVAKDLRTGQLRRFEGDRVLVACGAIGTSRLVMGSLELFEAPVKVAESAQFTLPFLSLSPTGDPRDQSDFTLNQFNMILDLDGEGYDLSQLHFYTYSHAFLEALPAPLRAPWMRWPRGHALRRLSVALGYLPSWASPSFELRARRPTTRDALPNLAVEAGRRSAFTRNAMFREVLQRIVSSGRRLDLWPVLPALRFSAPGKSYHWGGTFPHADLPRGQFSSDRLGRVGPWRRVHLVDASVFPSVASTTFTLTVMANAHRIADAVLRMAE